jgi:tetratricopeptide (TPR) repeat protein
VELGQDPVDWTFFKGSVLARMGRFEDALKHYDRVIDAEPGNAMPYRYRAHVRRCLAQYAQAVADYDTALELEGGFNANLWDYYQRATALWILGRGEDALADHRRVRILLGKPSYSDARRALVLRQLGRQAEADEHLRTTLPRTQDRWLGQIFRCLIGDLAPGELIDQAVESDDLERLCEAYYYAGEVLLGAGREAEAVTFFERCVATGVSFDQDTFPLSPMNEYELARWRLGSLRAASGG